MILWLMDRVETQDMWLQFPVLPHASHTTLAPPTALLHSPKPNENNRASVISNSKPRVPNPPVIERPGSSDTNTLLPACSFVHSGSQPEQTTVRCHPSSSATKPHHSISDYSDLVSVPWHCIRLSQPVHRETEDKLWRRGHHCEDRESKRSAKAKGQILH